MKAQAEEHLARIFHAAVAAVNPRKLIKDSVHLEGDELHVSGEGCALALALGDFDRIVVLGAGKASAPMAAALERILGDRITAGLVVVKQGYTEPLARIRCLEAGHPVPDAQGLRAAEALELLAGAADARTLVILLVSGGGSALLPAPLPPLKLEDKQAATRALLACGATIGEINCIRKHLSRLKGGRLARLLYPARVLSLILSDVVGDSLDTIASGLTVPDPSTYADALAIVSRYGLERSLPPAVFAALRQGQAGLLEETPKPGDPVFAGVSNVLLATNRTALEAARGEASALGYRPVVLSSRIVGEAREVAKVFAAIALDQRRLRLLVPPDTAGQPVCILSGGETTVSLRGSGKGGRNQELALAFLAELEEAGERADGIWLLSASTDGSDGPTDAAGAFASRDLVLESRRRGLKMREYLAGNDSYHFFKAVGGLLLTGPTNTNVCDVQICLLR